MLHCESKLDALKLVSQEKVPATYPLKSWQHNDAIVLPAGSKWRIGVYDVEVHVTRDTLLPNSELTWAFRWECLTPELKPTVGVLFPKGSKPQGRVVHYREFINLAEGGRGPLYIEQLILPTSRM